MAERDAWLAAALADLSETELGVLRLAADLIDRVAGSAVSAAAAPAEADAAAEPADAGAA
jgi:hypothetical protein